MEEIRVRTAYGYNLISDDVSKNKMLSRISDAMSIRNSSYPEFSKELDELLKKYKL